MRKETIKELLKFQGYYWDEKENCFVIDYPLYSFDCRMVLITIL